MNRTRIVAGLATALAAVGVAAGSGATFTAQSANPSNTFTSGTLTMANSKSGASIVTGSNMKPGDVKSGEVTITNTGSIAGKFTLSEKNAASGFGAGSLDLRIVDTTAGDKVVFDGEVGKLTAGGIALGTFQPEEAHTYRFTVTLDQTAPNADQGKSATADYQWDAVQE